MVMVISNLLSDHLDLRVNYAINSVLWVLQRFEIHHWA